MTTLKIDKSKLAIIDKILLGLSGKVEISDGVILELFGEFNFQVKKVDNKICIVFSGIKPRITATKGWGVFSMDFQGRICKLSIDKTGIDIDLEGLPDQKVEFI